MQEDTQNRPGRLQRWCGQLLDGENRWGFVRIQVDRFGVTRYRLVVYPPGISDVERRRLRVWRGAPIWGAALWVLSEIFLQQLIGSWTALAVCTGGVLALAGVAMAKAGEARSMVRSMGVVTMPGLTEVTTMQSREALLAMAMALTAADERVDEKRMSPLDHEALWWQVYEKLAPAAAVTSVRKMSH
ncbi:DUF6611 family protein [Mycolicibacterium stellerae]|uniref:DUF6611 family protein n=1 Tax=Mycolicibacterium stellerae TaxID=2358193 RepID=UPI000F0B59EC|nr:DUF6611 family protein [Mycolicibacterium stellerae]